MDNNFPAPDPNRVTSAEKSDKERWFDPIIKLFPRKKETAPASNSESKMRLTKNELIIIQLVMDLRVMWGADLDVIQELTTWYLMGDEYPFREENPDFVSLGLKIVNAKIQPKKPEQEGK